jgi:Flp pilus assembly protein TadG
MIEFLLVIVVVFVVFISMMQMIFLMHTYNTLADAAKEGVRFAVVHGTGLGTTYCSGPGTASGVTPAVACTDSAGTNVVNDVAIFTSVSLQTVSSGAVVVDYNPGSANTNNPNFGAQCSQAGCLVRVTVSHPYTPFFGLGWPNFTLHAAADGIITD